MKQLCDANQIHPRTLDSLSNGGLVVAVTDKELYDWAGSENDDVHRLWAVLGSKKTKQPTLFVHDAECKACKDPTERKINAHNAEMIKLHRER